MKALYFSVALLIIGLLVVGCSAKEIFYLPPNTGSFGAYRQVQPAINHPDSITSSANLFEPERISDKTLDLAASNLNPNDFNLPKEQSSVNFNSAQPVKKFIKYPSNQGAKNRLSADFKANVPAVIKQEAKKKVHETAWVSFVLALSAIVILLTGSLLGFAFGLASAIFGFIGLSKIKKKPEKFSGKGLAWVGVAVGILIPLFIVGYLLAFAGAFGS